MNNEKLQEAINDGDISQVREIIGSACYLDRSFSNGVFDKLVQYASQQINFMDDELVGDLISTTKETYTDEDYSDAVFELKNNFCKSRINDVKTIGNALYGSNEFKRSSEIGKDSVNSQCPNLECRPALVLAAIGIVLIIVALVLTKVL